MSRWRFLRLLFAAGLLASAEAVSASSADPLPSRQILVMLKVPPQHFRCDILGIARALQYAIEHKGEGINLSLAGPPGILLAKLLSIALARKESVIAAYDPTLPKGGFPASMRGVIAVADQSLQNLPANVYGAPGRDIPTAEPGGKWYLVKGTSYPVAHVSGLVALVRERNGGSPVSLARAASGRVYACASLLGTTRACDCDCRISQATRSSMR